MRLKIEGVLIVCIVVVLAKTCFEKFASKYAGYFNNLLQVEILVPWGVLRGKKDRDDRRKS